MKKFSFTLDTVKRLRADAEQAAQAELGRRIAAHRAAVEAREARERAVQLAESQLTRDAALAHELVQADIERDAAHFRLGAAAGETRMAEESVNRGRGELAEASRALEILDRLETKRRAEHRAAALAEEEQVVQEIAEARRAHAAGKRKPS
jgi:flagellar biosynthesis chaperone FliJ